MPAIVILGTQWGDEGKGKIIDALSHSADVIVRAQGGHNAGHTVIVNEDEYKLHLIPSGILHKSTQCFIGPGTVVDPKVLIKEIKWLEKKGLELKGRLHLSEAFHIIFPYHQLIDSCQEESKEEKIGTTKSGIGPCYSDKINRIGIRLKDLFDKENLKKALIKALDNHNLVFEKIYQKPACDLATILNEYFEYGAFLKDYLCPWEDWPIYRFLEEKKTVILEGAQGCYLDITFGTYPFVTSSQTVASGVCSGAGIGPTKITAVLGIAKAYTTRVGEGPFPTAFDEVEGFPKQQEARELGTTTGRIRRLGWLDIPLLRQAVELNSIDSIALTKLDILDELETIKICVGYKYQGKVLNRVPFDACILQQVEPIYEEMKGWKTKTGEIKTYQGLPQAAKDYITRIEHLCNTSVSLVSVGPERAQIIKKNPLY
jgi:adenylosuccinate synthase